MRVKDFNYVIDGYFRRELESTTTARSSALPGRGGGNPGSREIKWRAGDSEGHLSAAGKQPAAHRSPGVIFL